MTSEHDLEYQADTLITKLKHYLITIIGRSLAEANANEIYRALSYTLREEIMMNWLAVGRTIEQHDTRILYYLSMEYLPGKIISNNITNLNSWPIIRMVMHKINRNYADLVACEQDPGLGNGGLGRLASCFLDSLATLNYPAQAYGLRYQYGIFEQQLWDGLQIEAPDCWLLNETPWEFKRDLRRVIVKYGGKTKASKNIHGDEIFELSDFEEVGAQPFDFPIIGYAQHNKFSVITLRLWSTKESPRNFHLQSYNAGKLDQAAENTTLTDVLYPSDYHDAGKRTRLKQEFLLVSASLQDIIRHYLSNHENFRLFSDKVRIQINDTHPSLVIPELIRILMKSYDIPWKMAVDITQACTGYTNHTILSEALEQWDQGLFEYYLPRQYQIIQRLNHEFCNHVREVYPDDEERVRRMSIIHNGRIRMANMAVVGSHSVNGVAALHTEILKNNVFKDFYELNPKKFINVTNGVTHRRWLLHCNPELAKFITKRIGDGWITDFNKISDLAKYANDTASQEEFNAIKKKNKRALIEFINHENKLRDSTGKIIAPSPIIDVNSLFDVQIKRIHEYKRQLMNVLHLIMLYQEMKENPQNHQRIKRTAIIAGKAAASYETAKDIIRLAYAVARKVNKDSSISGALKIVFIENYNVSKAEIIIPAANLSEQISTAGTEASGTGNMKFSMNGALTIGTEDGANIEMREAITDEWWPFSFGCSAKEIEEMKEAGNYRAREYYEKNPKIRRALDTLRDRTFAINDFEHHAFSDLYHILVEGHYGGLPDRYFMLKDLESYYETQKKVEVLYSEPNRWAMYAIHNIAGMGKFSTDNSIKNYCKLIWGLEPCPSDDEILDMIRNEYSQYDKCRIY